jgi:hypothetical protein
MDGAHQAFENHFELRNIIGCSPFLRSKNPCGAPGSEQGIVDIHCDLEFTLEDAWIQLP